jgi:hypothetical protein
MLLTLAAAALALDLDVGPIDPGLPTALTATGCVPGGDVHFLVSGKGQGAGPCPASLGVCLDVVSPKYLGRKVCSPAGDAVWNWAVPAGVPLGTTLDLQAARVGEVSPVTTRWAGQWRHPITVDGDLTDWTPDAAFATSSGFHQNYVGWDLDHLYVASQHSDVQFGGAQHWLLVYVGDGANGSYTGVPFNTQQPGLPVPFTHQIRWKADNSYNSLMRWDGAAWVSTDFWLGTEGSSSVESEANQVIELAIPWAALGVTDTAVVWVTWLYEGSGFESTYSASPATAIVDGYDPDPVDWLVIDRTSFASPVSQNP